MQDLVTRYCWGEVWGNDALPFKTRSLLNIAMLTVLREGLSVPSPAGDPANIQ
jgi:4-carboxymuconolactone decarboxylase